MVTSRMRNIGWAAVLVSCTALYATLHFTVNTVKNNVQLAERKIVRLERDKFRLETEFLTRANQRQLAEWNEVDFGYQAPNASQFLGTERELAALGSPRAIGAPEPIRVAVAPREAEGDNSPFVAMVSPLSGKASAAEVPDSRDFEVAATEVVAEEFRKAATAKLSAKLEHGAGLRISIAGTPRVTE